MHSANESQTKPDSDARCGISILKDLLGLAPVPWLMCPSERLMLIGILQLLKPRVTLELGHGSGGCTEWLSRFSETVHTVDIDDYVIRSARRFPNVHPYHMRTSEALAAFAAEGRRFDLAIVDADHSTAGARSDLERAIPLADIILIHDVSNPGCREGYRAALSNFDCYADLDLLDGHVQADGLWGGLGIVVPSLKAASRSFLTPKQSTALLLERAASSPARRLQVLAYRTKATLTRLWFPPHR